ncbi:MAG TPA: DUF4170 domain-containing protein [Thermopetrobacter sp.]|nr:DUF4170 domain-containing protein [Thermopetrobacter sp.]
MSDKVIESKQYLHLVFGGRLKDVQGVEFADCDDLDIVGVYPSYAEAHQAWEEKARASIDDAEMRYFIVHIHRLLEPED